MNRYRSEGFYAGAVPEMRRPEVWPSAARSQLKKPTSVLEKLLPLVEDIVIIERVKARYEHASGKRLGFDQLATAAGFDPSEFA